MTITILTLFPEMFRGPFDSSIMKRAQKKGRVHIDLVNIRDFAKGAYKSVDDHPYGGGVGMLLRVDVVDRALTSVKEKAHQSTRQEKKEKVILLDPQGLPYNHKKAKELCTLDHLILVCGHYEGVDERIRSLVDEEISIGDYVLTGGEVPVMVVVDSITRLLPGTLKNSEATIQESFSQGLLEYPQYTRPETFKGLKVPSILLSGDHKKIAQWRKNRALIRTKRLRPDLITAKKDRSSLTRP